MNRTLLITMPKYDDGTEYLSYYASLVEKKTEELNIDKKSFKEGDITADNVSKYIKKKDPKLIFVNGHGDANSLEGDEEEVIFSVDGNINILRDRIVYARACHAGISFGRKMVEGNNGCFIGYKTPFSFWMDERNSAVPAKDKTAKLFLEPSNEVVISLIKGNTTKEADKKSKKMMVDNMSKILKMQEKDEPGAMGWLEILWNNFEGQILHGNEEATF